jgi:hypothetical protein
VTRPMSRVRPVLRGSIALAAVVVFTFTSQVFAASRAIRPLRTARIGAVTSASGAVVTQRMSASLQEFSRGGTTRLVDVLVIQAAGTGRPTTLKTALRVSLRGDPGHEYWAGRVPADHLTKLASGAGVEYVADNGPKAPPVLPDQTAPTASQSLVAGKQAVALVRQATASGVVKSFADAVNSDSATTGPGGLPTDWYEVGLTHKSALAWANGFTGEGVKVAVADDGVDFGHPDLQGTQAYVTDPASPYYGWPMAFDPYSTYLYALDVLTGSTNVRDAATWFSATDATITEADPEYGGVTYALPGTSLSGTYHLGRLWDQNLMSARWYSEPVMLLVADEETSGVYGTVYVDLNDNQDFTDDKACTKDDPISYLDFVDAAGSPGTDGIADLSGGMVYWISDGVNQPPYAEQVFSDLGSSAVDVPAAGSLVCMMGSYDLAADHGTLCASVVAGQGRIDGSSLQGTRPAFKTGSGGMVQGGGRDAEVVAIGDVYSAYALSTLLAYDFSSYGPDAMAGSGDEVQIVSNSYGESATDNDEWDYASRYVTLLNTGDAPNTTFLFATGNGGPGYGTSTAPSPSTAIKVGASTQFGADGGWDSIDTSAQVTFGDVAPFSNRGPTAMGHLAPTIVADGAYASGAVALGMANGNGWNAWETWGGTSRSTPVASGNLALVYQAFEGEHGRWPTYDEARMLLSSGATDLNYDTLVQGAGMVDANRSTMLAAGMAGAGIEASPTAWYPGGYRGAVEPAFAQVVNPGDTVTAPLTLSNPGTSTANVTIADSWMQRTGSTVVTVTLDPANETTYMTTRPDALIDVTGLVPAGTQLLVARATVPLSRIDPDSDNTAENSVRLLAYDWTDRNGNGRLWNDANANGAVNTGEIDLNEYMRFTYCLATGPSLEVRVQEPLGRSHDGIYIGLQHQARSGPVTVRVELSYWERTDMPWLSPTVTSTSVPAGGSRVTTMRCVVPADAPLGTYEGEYRVSVAGTVTVVPVVITVAGDSAGVTYGGATPYEQLMDGSRVFGYQDWNWRAEAGDWRFFATDVPPSEAGTGTLLLAHTSWQAPPTDIDTLIYGPAEPDPTRPSSGLGPYDLELKGGSPNTNTGAGVWTFDTSTGGASDWVTGPLSAGLNEIVLHNVVFSGTRTAESFGGETGVLGASATSLSYDDAEPEHVADLSFTSTLDLPGFSAEGYGLAPVWTGSASVTQDGTWIREFDVEHAGFIEASIANQGSDLDLYLDYWDGGGWYPVAASETPMGDEYLKVLTPGDGLYRMRVFGFDVNGGTDGFAARLAVPQGTGVTVTGLPAGAVSAGKPIALEVALSAPRLTLDEREGELLGVVNCGPAGSPNALQVPISLTYPLFVEQSVPAPGAYGVPDTTEVTVRFSRRVDPDTLTADSLYLTANGSPVEATIAYDDLTATARFVATLQADTEYTVTVTRDVRTPDDDACTAQEWAFSTGSVQPATSVILSLGATTARYGSKVGFTASASRGPSGTGWIDASAPVVLKLRASGSSVWTTVTAGVTGADGVWKGTVTASKPGSFKAVRLLSPNGLASSSSLRALAVTFAPTISVSTTTVRHGHSIKVTARVRPSVQAAHRYARLEIYSHGHWVLAHYVKLNGSGSATFYERRSAKGTRKIRLKLTSGKGYGTGASNSITLHWD